eukprot:CAMPEP_0197444240 /NCGR_PEP_ID=MMETSP1175-20131217/9775_1 /TAXON_ID=1003142 /ORGANISM="Triceratium dubium, Strain CCMP147" /LENGTH=45 /DNA_ID= /DNA_START= /DNA_END= /DNA_ORIENTATION=
MIQNTEMMIVTIATAMAYLRADGLAATTRDLSSSDALLKSDSSAA